MTATTAVSLTSTWSEVIASTSADFVIQIRRKGTQAEFAFADSAPAESVHGLVLEGPDVLTRLCAGKVYGREKNIATTFTTELVVCV